MFCSARRGWPFGGRFFALAHTHAVESPCPLPAGSAYWGRYLILAHMHVVRDPSPYPLPASGEGDSLERMRGRSAPTHTQPDGPRSRGERGMGVRGYLSIWMPKSRIPTLESAGSGGWG